MKLEKIFDVKDGKLVKADGNSADGIEISAENLSWREIEPDAEGGYNEEKLAGLRLFLKDLEGTGKFVFINPEKDRDGDFSQFTSAMKHAARRIKDCTAVAGFAVPAGTQAADAAHFMAELSEKHAHYVFFSRDKIEGTAQI